MGFKSFPRNPRRGSFAGLCGSPNLFRSVDPAGMYVNVVVETGRQALKEPIRRPVAATPKNTQYSYRLVSMCLIYIYIYTHTRICFTCVSIYIYYIHTACDTNCATRTLRAKSQHMKPVALHVGMTGMRVLVGIRGAYFCTVFRKKRPPFLV